MTKRQVRLWLDALAWTCVGEDVEAIKFFDDWYFCVSTRLAAMTPTPSLEQELEWALAALKDWNKT